MEINLGVQHHPSSWLFVVKEMDGGSLCQAHAVAITPAAMIDGGEGKRGGGAEKRETWRGASITPFNLPVTARAWKWGVGGVIGGESALRRLLVKGLFLQPEFVFPDFIKPPDHMASPTLPDSAELKGVWECFCHAVKMTGGCYRCMNKTQLKIFYYRKRLASVQLMLLHKWRNPHLIPSQVHCFCF